MTITTLDTTTIEDLDFDHQPACEAKDCATPPLPATHFAESIQCGCTKFLCSEHTARLRELMATEFPLPMGTCSVCRARLIGQPRDCVRLVPL